jgi:hypothetical protein
MSATRHIPMAPLESSSILSDLVGAPHVLGVEVDIDGDVDRSTLQRAIAAAALRHPMARVTTQGSRLRPLMWALHERLDIPLVAHHQPWDEQSRPCLWPVPIGRAPFAVHSVTHRDFTRLHLAVNHAAFDGLGAIRVLRSMFANSTGADDPVPDVDPLAVRGRSPQAGAAIERPWRDGPKKVSHLRHGGGSGFWLVERTIEVPRAPGVTINDLMQAATHVVLAGELALQGGSSSTGHRIRTLMPVNSRPAAWASEVVGNHAWLESIDSVPGDHSSGSAVLAAVQEQTARIRGGSQPDRMLELLGAPWVPPLAGRLAFAAGAKVRAAQAATASVSNLGNVADLGTFAGASVRALRFSPPCRSPRGFAVGVTGYGGKLHLTLRVLQGVGSAQQAHTWLEQIGDVAAELASGAALASTRPSGS